MWPIWTLDSETCLGQLRHNFMLPYEHRVLRCGAHALIWQKWHSASIGTRVMPDFARHLLQAVDKPRVLRCSALFYLVPQIKKNIPLQLACCY
jgi:hypothetical protein